MLPLPLLFCSFHLSVGWKAGTKAGAEAANLDYEVTLARENTSGRATLWRQLGLLALWEPLNCWSRIAYL